MNKYNDYLKIILAMLIWGSIGIFVRLAAQPAETIVFFRVTTAFIILGIFLLFNKKTLIIKKNLFYLIISGFVVAFNWFFLFKAIQTTTIGNAVLTYYLAPIFSIIWARFFLGERLEHRAVYALCIAFSGIALLLSSYEFSLQSHDFIGILYGITGGLFYSIVVILVKKLSDINTSNIVFVQMGICSLLFLPFVIKNPPVLTTSSLMAMLVLGSVHTAFALLLYFSALNKIKVQHVSILSYLDPTSSLIFAYIVFNEKPSFTTMMGGCLILIASSLVLLPKHKKNEPPLKREDAKSAKIHEEKFL